MCEYTLWVWKCRFSLQRPTFQKTAAGNQIEKVCEKSRHADRGNLIPSECPNARCVKQYIIDGHCSECNIRLRNTRPRNTRLPDIRLGRPGWVCRLSGKVNKTKDRQGQRGELICEVNVTATRHDDDNVLWVPQSEDEICPGFNDWKDESFLATSKTYEGDVVSECECIEAMVDRVEFACVDEWDLWEVLRSNR